MANEFESRKNRGKRGCKEQAVKIKSNWDAYFYLMLKCVVCIDFILLYYALFKNILGTCRSFVIIEILWYNTRSILDECRTFIQLSIKTKIFYMIFKVGISMSVHRIWLNQWTWKSKPHQWKVHIGSSNPFISRQNQTKPTIISSVLYLWFFNPINW